MDDEDEAIAEDEEAPVKLMVLAYETVVNADSSLRTKKPSGV